MNGLTKQKKGYGNRVWEVDLLRGILILFVVFDHVMFDIGAMFADSFSTPLGIRISDWAAGYVFESSAFGRWRSVTNDFFIGSFVILSGVSVSFSKNNALRGLKMSVWAVGLSVAMLFYGEITQDNSVWMNFNVLHVLALSILLWALLDWLKTDGDWIFLIAVLAIAVGSYFNMENEINLVASQGQKQWTRDLVFWLVNNNRVSKLSPGDYLPFLPYFGWFLAGALAGRAIYKSPRSIMGYEATTCVRPFCFCGRHSLFIYFASQVLAVGLLYLIVEVWGWL